jgi:hypothetical protein
MDSALMLLGFTRAVGRFMDGSAGHSMVDAFRVGLANPDHADLPALLRETFGTSPMGRPDLDEEFATAEWYIALFEALNWAVSLDDRLTKDWPFEEFAFGDYWCDDFVGGDLVRGFRYARNAVHHDWSLALDLDPEQIPIQTRLDLLSLGWTSNLETTRSSADGKRAYDEYLAERPVGDTLLEISDLFDAGVRIVSGRLPVDDVGPAAIKRSADHRYDPPQ